MNWVPEARILPHPLLCPLDLDASPRIRAGLCSYSPYHFHVVIGVEGGGRPNPLHEESFDRSTSVATPGQACFFYQALKKREVLTLVLVSSIAELLRAVATCILLRL